MANMFFTRLRAAAGLAITWGLAWGAIGGLLAAISFAASGASLGDAAPFVRVLLSAVVRTAVLGALSGALFSFLLPFLGRGESVGKLTGPRVAMIGGLATFWLAFLFRFNDYLVVNSLWGAVVVAVGSGILGAASSSLTLAAARRGSPQLIESVDGEPLGLPS